VRRRRGLRACPVACWARRTGQCPQRLLTPGLRYPRRDRRRGDPEGLVPRARQYETRADGGRGHSAAVSARDVCVTGCRILPGQVRSTRRLYRVIRNGYSRYMARLATISDADLARRIRRLRGEQLRRVGKTHTCVRCGGEFHARSGASYCSGACRVAAFRMRARAAGSTGGGGTR
jgi:hypothetical protein